jgi:predicted outer membrane protein
MPCWNWSKTKALSGERDAHWRASNHLQEDEMNKITFAGLGVSLLMLGTAPAALAATDDEFIKTVIGINLAEIALGEAAQEKATSDDVKAYGKQLVEEHTKSNEEAKTLATSLNVTVPTETSTEEQQAYERLSAMKGAEFDREFLKHMVMGHETAIAAFEDKADDAENDVSNFAEKSLPVLKKHLETAQSLSEGQGTAMDEGATSHQMAAESPAAQPGSAAEAPTDTDSAAGYGVRPEGLQPVDAAEISADNLIDTTVYGAGDENLGEIGDVILAKDGGDGKIDAVVIDVGGFLGIGEKSVAIAFDNLEIMRDENGAYYIYSKFSREQLEAATAYDEGTFEQDRDRMILRSDG